MACLVSITLIAPLRASLTSTKADMGGEKLRVLKRHFLIHIRSSMGCRNSAQLIVNEETHQLEFALGRISSTATVTTAQKVLCPCSSNKCIPSANRSCLQSPLTFSRFLSLTSFRNLDVDYFSNRVISGYWVGPDIDDGWGFVEAVIDRIT